MNKTERSKQENAGAKEISSSTLVPWLSGLFETGGTISATISADSNSRLRVIPAIYIQTSEEKARILGELLGGYHVPREEGSRRWMIANSVAINLAKQMEPFSPSRKKAIELFRNLENANTVNQKAQLVRTFRENGRRRIDVPEEQYRYHLENDIFTAGIFDGIGTIDNAPYAPLRVQFESTNKPLVDALKSKYGGSITLRVEPGTVVSLKEKTWTTINPSYELTLAYEDSKKLLDTIAPYVQLKRKEVSQALGTASSRSLNGNSPRNS